MICWLLVSEVHSKDGGCLPQPIRKMFYARPQTVIAVICSLMQCRLPRLGLVDALVQLLRVRGEATGVVHD